MQGVKRKRRCQIECKDHIFSIQSLKANSSKYDIKLLFCPKFQRQPLPPEQTFPQYNNDNKFYTSAFILGVDRRVLFKNQQQELMDHQKQMRDSLEKHNQLVFPRPNSKHSLCSVCKQHYKNYYFHISSQEHRQKISESLYNTHIKNLCNLYINLWDGAEERADQEAEKRAAQEEERRQRLAEMTIQENQQEDQSLLDVQRGDYDNLNQGAQDDFFGTYNEKPNKKYARNTFKDDQTIPFTARPSKRSAPEGRTYTSEYLRKKFLFNNQIASQNRAYRERQQRRYQRERDKLKTQRDNPENNKQLIKMNQKQGDTFIVMKATYAITITPLQNQNIAQNQIQLQPQPQIQAQTQTQSNGEFVWKRTANKLRKDLQKASEKLQRQKQDFPIEKYEKENKKYEIQYGDEQKYPKRGVDEDKQADKYDYRRYGYYPYPPPISPYMIPPEYKPNHFKNDNYKANQLKNIDDQKDPNRKLQNHQYKNMPPYYYNPYMYPPIYQPYPPRPQEKIYQNNEKDKIKPSQKPLQYPMHYPWPYPNNPYFMPPVSIPPQNQDQQASSNSKTPGGTSININFPMYMCPPPSIPPRYPPPYMGYQYPYNMPSQPRQNQTNVPPNNPNINHLHGPPPHPNHSNSHIPLIQSAHNRHHSPPHSSMPIQQPPYSGYPPYIPHQYHQHYQYGQPKQGPPQHQIMNPK